MVSNDIDCTLNYTDDVSGERPYYFMRPQTEEEKVKFGGRTICNTGKGIKTTVRCGRG